MQMKTKKTKTNKQTQKTLLRTYLSATTKKKLYDLKSQKENNNDKL